ncbi:sugar transferase [Anaerosacchariphilus polymeriproducens]|uniref:Sugar transferase n=1 Tax=Anaerosacchariphilus polymeriproducens TaxID=1812858 RepID=A0A371AR91_9FIRM|nr:sugar transferase [Anaerosacchariphilus polymeriproducens]RDU22095.1 sugar transferase [Anaerosacchariphilus polymeriproducens]
MERKDYEQYKRILRFIAALWMISCETIVFAYVWYKYFNPQIRKPFIEKGNWLMIAVYIILLIIFFAAFGGLKIGYLKKTNIIFSQILSSICINIVVLIQIVLLSGRLKQIGELAVIMSFILVIDVVLIVLGTQLFDMLFYKIFPPRKMLLIFEDHPPGPLLQKMFVRKDKYIINEQVNLDVGLDKIEELILDYEGVILCDIHAKMRNRILKYCYQYSIRTYTTPKISDIILKNSESLHLFDTPLLLSRNTGLTFEQKIIKRLIDIIVSSLILILTSPIMLVTAIVIKLYDGGPVLFKQVRVTLNRKHFFVYKFRSMIVDAEKDGVAKLAVKNDSRITPVGKFIRATRIDELPQLWNILNGDMSLVGPRPERPEIIEKYQKSIPEFSYRLKVKGGLTGYAQVYGKYNTTAYDKLKMDLMYIENYSIFTDIKIIFMTFKVLFMEESTEGLDKAQLDKLLEQDQSHIDER